MLTDREQEIVALLRRDPLIGSAQIAERLGTTRAAVNVHLSNLGKKGVIRGRGYLLNETPGVVVIGGANMDVKARSGARAVPGTSNPGEGSMSPGGVGRNIAENLARLGSRVELIAAVGADPIGDQLLAATSAAGVRVDGVRRSAHPTGTYTAVLDHDGELLVAVADMAATDALAPADLGAEPFAGAAFVVLDGNLATPTAAFALEVAATAGAKVILEPVSVPKAARLAALLTDQRPVHAITPNRAELAALSGLPVDTDARLRAAIDRMHERGVETVWVRLGADGSLLSAPTGLTALASPATDVVDVTGAGDAMLAAFCHRLLAGADAAEAAAYGHAAAAATCASAQTVRPDLTDRLVRSYLS
ncbi:MAG: winged helix-turn-helix transcriptional regulator [Nocardioides sp.]|uniref:carbohydrate kinase n=1 Tax=Nocardioides sp. TaxID=35761 RepID=UPI0039E5A773